MDEMNRKELNNIDESVNNKATDMKDMIDHVENEMEEHRMSEEREEEPVIGDKMNEKETVPIDEGTVMSRENKQRKKGNLKGFAAILASGILGSSITLFAFPHTDYFKEQYQKIEQQNAAVSNQEKTSGSSNVKTQPTAAPANSSIADIVEQASKAVVGIVNYQKQNDFYSQSSQTVQKGSGSGIIFKKEGDTAYIVTNNHVIEGASKVEISLYDGKKVEAKLIGSDALTDLAVLKIDSKDVTDVIHFGDSTTLRPGDPVWAIGNPLGLDLSRTVTQGIVSAVNRSVTASTSAGNWDLNVIQTDAAINPGNSGGALINAAGQVIGINSMKISESGVEGLGFAIPSNDLIPIVDQIIKDGKIIRPYLGVGLADLEEVPQMYMPTLPDNVDKGAVITNIDPNSAAAKAGLQAQDVIVSINGSKVEGAIDLRKYLYNKSKVGDKVELQVYHQGKLKMVYVTLTSNNAQS
ncbi:trypsin-like peptidase domain-containing protein [Bacillus sp. 03113]|uniref:S1C family serine protease n=1 Tax=Bacillus sp. 03113 TaxID=2578211 RepID=UPI002852E783|nr:trypsin-like peptidase domain-containing protein [Bacillus sp. 03113]